MKPNTEELRKKYMDNPPEGMTSKDIRRMSEDELLDMDYFLKSISKDIRRMSEDELLDMDYFLNEDNLFADEAVVEGFYIF